MKLNPKAFGLTAGIISGLAIFIVTIWLVISGTEGRTIGLLKYIYLGYDLSYLGALIGLIWGFVDGLIGGYIFALVYNWLLPKESK